MGVVIRDNNGEVMAAMSCKGYGLVSAKVVEAYSLQRALQWARGGGFGKLIVESDNSCVVSAVLDNSIQNNRVWGSA
ncbi:hypothetical protein SLE2022_310400 [Rubroshorea leprosula]